MSSQDTNKRVVVSVKLAIYHQACMGQLYVGKLQISEHTTTQKLSQRSTGRLKSQRSTGRLKNSCIC